MTSSETFVEEKIELAEKLHKVWWQFWDILYISSHLSLSIESRISL